MDKPIWIAYHCKTRHIDNQFIHYVFLVDAETLEFTGTCYTETPNFKIIIEMIEKSLKTYPVPGRIYVTKDWIKELAPHFPEIYFKNTTSFPREKRRIVDMYVVAEVTSILKEFNPDIMGMADFE